MNLLAEISEGSLGKGAWEQLNGSYVLRKSARAILHDADGHIAVQYLNTHRFHKLPGGGVDEGETTARALKREVLEEVGAESKIGYEVGVTIEYRNFLQMIHISYCYTAYVQGTIGHPQLEKEEMEEGQETLWLTPTETLRRMQMDEPLTFEGHFIRKREMSFLEAYLKTRTTIN